MEELPVLTPMNSMVGKGRVSTDPALIETLPVPH
jgi:hypothetical protein